MRIDLGAHVGHWPFRPLSTAGVAPLLRRMDQTGVDRAVVANLHGLFYQNPQHANEELAAWIAAETGAAERLVPFAVINPSYPGWRDDLDACRTRLGCKGVRLYPQYHDYDWSSPALAEFLALAEAEDLPVAFSLRMIDARGRSWLDTDVVQAETEQLRLSDVAAAVAGHPRLRWIVLQAIFEQLDAATVRQLREARVLFDTARATTVGVPGPNSYDLQRESERFGREKFAFSTMSPFTDVLSPLWRLTAGGLPADHLEALFANNARALLAL